MKPNEAYSVAQFTQDALKLIDEIILRGRIPLLVGGTMMYFNGLEKGINQMPTTNHEIRKHLEMEAKQIGWPKLYEKLKENEDLLFCMKEIATKMNMPDIESGMYILFSYDYLYLFHRCVCDFLENGKILNTHLIKSILEKD
jgi:tRNA dimethylallyltransferase